MVNNSADNNRSDSGREPLPTVSSAFGEEDNRYAYPSSRGMSGLGVGSVVCALCSFFCLITGFVSIGLAIAGLVHRRRDVLCWIGLGLSVAFLAYNIVSLVQLCGSSAFQDMMAGMM